MARLNHGQWILLPKNKGPGQPVLDDYLQQHARLFVGKPVDTWFEAGYFQCNDRTLTRESVLRSGDQPRLFRPPWEEPVVPDDIHIVHEDASLLVVDKPPGLPVTPTGDFYQNTLLHLLRAQTNNAALSPVHRLDIETSGLIAFAKQPDQRGFYQMQFQQNRIAKSYTALVFGRFPTKLTIIEMPLAKDSLIYTKAVPDPDGIPARTEVAAVAHDLDQDMSVLELKPITGRTNQLRAHCAGLGFPIVGDKKYGADPQLFLRWLEDKNTAAYLTRWRLPYQALHSRCLALDTPAGTCLALTSQRDVVQTWRDLLQQSARPGGADLN
ncbi:RluA family pseudouridine synthase [Acanthopleuribacter pedis]|uniref:RluA family pseudouridine synthase n=1 Tax=Acanthopleuribacter pedis TaxID=442870 RepID=A0A8J7QDK2_9BACT|nr:RluA family pseudouridine synthase [Acanthopleuribacter pedis]MBO1321315.1 RluA family pseudouridine synthase [Acanthopleuribacter pedis]